MKKLLLFFVPIFIMAYSLNAQSTAGEDSNYGKVIHIGKSDFLKKIYDYEKNPDKWVYNGKKPAIMAVHAGLECGILGSKYPNWDMISFGPTLCSPHSPDERVNIASVGKFWEFLKETLKNIPVK